MMARIAIARTGKAVCTAPSPLYVRLEWRVGSGASIPDRLRMQCLRGGGGGGRERRRSDGPQLSTDACEQGVDTAAKRGRTDSDSEGNEDDQHGVLGGRGPALVPTKAIDETKHLRFLLQLKHGPMANACQRRARRHSADVELKHIPTIPTCHERSGYGVVVGGRVGGVTAPSSVPTFVNRELMPPPSAVAPTATARAMKTTSIAYSVAVAPRSSRRNPLRKPSMSDSFCK